MTDTVFDGVLPDLQGIDDQELRFLIERNAQIQDMVRHPGWAYYCDYLVALIEPTQRRIMDGGAHTIEEYRTETGRAAGIRLAITAPTRLAQQVERMQEEREEPLEPD
jgi:hypothetical protein